MAFYDSVLVISDNPALVRRFKMLVNDLFQGNEVSFSYSNTVLSLSKEDRSAITGYACLDLKNNAHLDFIVEHFNLVISLHCKQLFPAGLINKVKCINVHPGYNPLNRGWYPQVFSILHNRPIGATIHEIDGQLDHGPIIDRGFVKMTEWDTSGSLYRKIIDKEFELLGKRLPSIINNDYSTQLPEEEGHLYVKKDFEMLKEIDLDKKGSFREFVNYLRAMTHDGFNNCYFQTKSGEKIFLSLSLKKENE